MAKIPDIKPGDLVKVYAKIIEGNKERISPFQGIVIQLRGSDIRKTITVRKISAGVGIERIFPLSSPMVTKIEIKKRGKVRRAKLNYLRKTRGRKMKIKDATTYLRKEDIEISPEAKAEAAAQAKQEPKPAPPEKPSTEKPAPKKETAEKTTEKKDKKPDASKPEEKKKKAPSKDKEKAKKKETQESKPAPKKSKEEKGASAAGQETVEKT